MYAEKTHCRLCGQSGLDGLFSLGDQHLTGVFPPSPAEQPGSGPLELALCRGCGLVQLKHSYEPSKLYGTHYGYRSSLNSSMVAHLRAKVEALRTLRPVGPGDVVLDIGSNDGTTLSFYPEEGLLLAGMDPSAEKFRHYYRPDIRLVVDFFSASRFASEFGPSVKPKIITSIAMFYDLEEPLEFVRQIKEILHPEGVWHFEQSYLPLMLETNSYDTICHEHLEYYGLKQIQWMTRQAGLEIVDVSLNDINGGSFAVTVAHRGSGLPVNAQAIAELLEREERMEIHTGKPYQTFAEGILKHREDLLALLHSIKAEGKLVLGYGASTKGNVIMQYCGLDVSLLPAIAEVNESKFGAFTPGTSIPIISEIQARAMRPDYFLVFPWHFRPGIIARESEFLKNGGKLIFPLPCIDIVSG